MPAESAFRALPTAYNGYRFRSRLEARWAVFFDALGLAYRYEPEGFSLPPCRRADCWAHGTAAGPVRQEERAFAYLPDFYLPTLATWVEIKPAAPSEEELEKLMRLHCHTGQAAVLLAGDCADTNSYDRPPAYVGYVPGDESYLWTQCIGCAVVGITYCGLGDRLAHRRGCPQVTTTAASTLRAAFAAARAARFGIHEPGSVAR